jgi:ADP-ribose pyrophosphatase YjhB (NUDIX family)
VTQYFASDPTELGISVSAMVWRGREFLLMRRADNGHWGLPGGFVELGESVADAARREVIEETGWSIVLGRLIGVYSDPATQVVDYLHADGPDAAVALDGRQAVGPGEGRGRVQIVNLCFQAKALEQGEPTTPEETLEIGFFAADALPEPFVPIHRVRIEDGLAKSPEAVVR